MAIPSITMIPSGYKAEKVYSALPTNGDGDLTFNRDSSATRVNKSGLIESISTDVPRLDYSDGGCPSLLLEPASTNLVSYSQDFSQSDWDKLLGGAGSAPIVTSNYATSPDGTLNASRVVFNLDGGTTISDFSRIRQTATATTPTLSCYLKSNTTESYDLALSYSGDSINVVTVTPNQWTRVEYQATASGTFAFRLELRGSYTANDTADILAWGAQLEEQPFATSYIPTTGSAVTRSQDTASKTGLSSYINSSEGVLYVETKGLSDLPSISRYISLSRDGESSFYDNMLMIQHRANGTLRVYANGGVTANIHFNIDIDFAENHKIAVLYKLNGYKLFVDGVEQSLFGTPVQTVFSGLDNLSFNLRTAGNWNGSIRDLRVYNTTLTDLELTNLTTI